MEMVWTDVGQLDEELRERVEGNLGGRNGCAFHDVQVEVQHGTVTLTGQLQTFHEKQVAIACCWNVLGLLAIVDCLTVADWDTQPAEFPYSVH